jgi:hypothetical protein
MPSSASPSGSKASRFRTTWERCGVWTRDCRPSVNPPAVKRTRCTQTGQRRDRRAISVPLAHRDERAGRAVVVIVVWSFRLDASVEGVGDLAVSTSGGVLVDKRRSIAVPAHPCFEIRQARPRSVRRGCSRCGEGRGSGVRTGPDGRAPATSSPHGGSCSLAGSRPSRQGTRRRRSPHRRTCPGARVAPKRCRRTRTAPHLRHPPTSGRAAVQTQPDDRHGVGRGTSWSGAIEDPGFVPHPGCRIYRPRGRWRGWTVSGRPRRAWR